MNPTILNCLKRLNSIQTQLLDLAEDESLPEADRVKLHLARRQLRESDELLADIIDPETANQARKNEISFLPNNPGHLPYLEAAIADYAEENNSDITLEAILQDFTSDLTRALVQLSHSNEPETVKTWLDLNYRRF